MKAKMHDPTFNANTLEVYLILLAEFGGKGAR
jgi:hypothetical protein